MNRFMLMLMVVILSSLVILGGCSQKPAPVPAPTNPTESTESTEKTNSIEPVVKNEEPDKKFELKMNKTNSETSGAAKIEIAMADRIRERTNGNLDITIYYSSTLIEPTKVIEGLELGLIDMAGYGWGSNSGSHYLHTMADMEFIGWPDYKTSYEIWNQFVKKWPEFQTDLRNVKLLGSRFFSTGNMILTTEKPVVVPADLKGMRMISKGQVVANALAAAGGAALDIPVPDTYNALERGLADGNLWPAGVVRAFRTGELYKHQTIFDEINFKLPTHGYLINMEIWDSLPTDYQEILMEEVDKMCLDTMELDYKDDMKFFEDQKAEGVNMINLTLEQEKEWQNLFVSEHEIFLLNAEKAGFTNVREIYADLFRILDEYRETGKINMN